MIARTSLLVLLLIIASIALAQRRRVAALIGMGLFSLVLSATYLLHSAPDVAVTEAAIGAAFVTMIYVIAIRRTGRLIVVADEAPDLLAREGDRLIGLEYEILVGFARELGLDLSVRFVPRHAVEAALLAGEADLAAGGIVFTADPRFHATRGYLETALIRIGRGRRSRRGPDVVYKGYFEDVLNAVREGRELTATLDLARFMTVSRYDLAGWDIERLPGKREYTFLVPERRKDLYTRLEAYLSGLSASGELDELIERNLKW